MRLKLLMLIELKIPITRFADPSVTLREQDGGLDVVVRKD
jgi:hypothetical protein